MGSSDKFNEIPDASEKKLTVDASDFTPEPVGGAGSTVEIFGEEDIYALGNQEPKHATLGDYLSTVTEKNAYGPGSGVTTVKLTDESTGEPASFTVDGEDSLGRTWLSEQTIEYLRSYFGLQSGGGSPGKAGDLNLGGGGTFDANVLAELGVNKNDQKTGHTLLSSIEGNDWDTDAAESADGMGGGNISSKNDIAKKLVSDVLTVNRFSPGGSSPYIQDRTFTSGMYSHQKTFGVFDSDATGVTLEDVAKIGLGLVLRQTGDSQDPADAGATSSMVEGIGVQLAMSKVPTIDLMAGSVVDVEGADRWALRNVDPTGAMVDGQNESSLAEDGGNIIWKGGGKTSSQASFNSKSYGALNSWLEQFDGPLPISMIFLTVLAALATLVVAVILGLILDLIFLLFPPSDAEEQYSSEPKPMGGAAGTPGFGMGGFGYKIRMFLGIPFLNSGESFLNCMFQGVIQFFIGGNMMSPRFLGVSAGYYIVICRAAIRDISQIGDAIANADFSNPVGAVESIFLIIDAFATSTTFQFLNTLAKLGDLALTAGGIWGTLPPSFAPTEMKVGDMAPKIGNLHMKSRTWENHDQPDYGLAWRFGTLPSAYVLPKNLLTFIVEAGASPPAMPSGYSDEDGVKISKMNLTETGDGRIKHSTPGVDPEEHTVEWLEEQLDSYYMPFYFHDLRTNEIIAFHAFVDNISDSFSPEWNSVKGFGRQDPVQIFKSTSRKIGLSFWVIPTNPEDADEAWFAINRLVAMVYPQWSRGTQRVSADGLQKFIQPFSQVATASPVVRMRLGDLFQSNYSIMGLMRNFGYSSPSFDLTFKATDDDANAGAMGETTSAKAFDAKTAKLEGLQAALDALVDRVGKAPDAIECAQIGFAVALTSPLIPSPEKGFAIGEVVILSPGSYKCVKSSPFPETILGFEPLLRRMRFTTSGIMKVIQILVRPLSALAEGDPQDPSTAERCVVSTKPKKNLKVRYVLAPIDLSVDLVKQFADAEVAGVMAAWENVTLSMPEATLNATHDLFNDPLSPADQIAIAAGMKDAPVPAEFMIAQEVQNFFAAGGDTPNPIVKSFNEASGKGLAGVITQLDFDWNTAPWDTSIGRRAPQYCKVTMGFSPIHDLPLGLDADGAMSNPAYMVGSMIQEMFGGPPSAWNKGSVAPGPAMRIERFLRMGKVATATAPTDPNCVEKDPDEPDLG